MGKTTPHSQELVDRLRDLMLQGKSAAQCAKILNISRCSALGIAHRRWGGFGALTPSAGRKAPKRVRVKSPRTEKPMQPPPPKYTAPPPPPEPVTVVVPFEGELYAWELKYGACRWPTRETEVPKRWLHCGKACRVLSKYCPEHHKLAYVPSLVKQKTGRTPNYGYAKTKPVVRMELQQTEEL